MGNILYENEVAGSVVVDDTDMDPPKSASRIERFDAFFRDVPLWGGQEWVTLSVDEIVLIFREAAIDILEVYQKHHDEAVREHSMRNRIVRWWREFFGWKAPSVPSYEVIVRAMAVRCVSLSKWMRQNSSRPFYADCDMSVFIDKPAAVAERLISI